MLFVNETGEKVKVRLVDNLKEKLYSWVWLKPGDTIDVPAHYGKNLGLTPKELAEKADEVENKVKTIEGKSGDEKVETKVIEKKKKKKK